MKNRVIIAALAFGALAGCTKESSSVAISGDSQVKFTSASIATRTVDNEWELGDKIGITTYDMDDDTDYQNMQHSAAADGSTTTFDPIDSDNTIYYPNGQTSDITFYAYYPYSDTYSTDTDYVTMDISYQKDDMGAVDFMTATSSWSATTNGDDSETPITFDFQHKLSQVIFNLTMLDEVGIDSNSEVEDNSYEATIKNVVKSKAYSILDGEEYDDDIEDELTSVELTTTALGEDPCNRKVTAILHPSEVDATVELLINGEKFTFAIQETLEGGYSYTYSVTVGRDKIIVSESKITDWTVTAATDFSGYQNNGDGTRNNPYQIYTEEELLQIGTGDWYGDSHYILMSDITLSETYTESIFPISDTGFAEYYEDEGITEAYSAYFNGTFDGNGHTITNPASSWIYEYQFALFESIGSNGKVFDLNISLDEDTFVKELFVAAIASNNLGVIENCSCEGSFSVSYLNSDYVYLVENNYGTIIDCTNSVVVKNDDEGVEFSQSAYIAYNNDEGTIN